MQTIATDKTTNDILIENGGFVFKKDKDAVEETVKHNMLVNYGELVYDALAGIRFFDYVFADKIDLTAFKQNAIAEIEKIAEVKNVSAFDITVKDGALIYRAVINTIYGEVQLNA